MKTSRLSSFAREALPSLAMIATFYVAVGATLAAQERTRPPQEAPLVLRRDASTLVAEGFRHDSLGGIVFGIDRDADGNVNALHTHGFGVMAAGSAAAFDLPRLLVKVLAQAIEFQMTTGDIRFSPVIELPADMPRLAARFEPGGEALTLTADVMSSGYELLCDDAQIVIDDAGFARVQVYFRLLEPSEAAGISHQQGFQQKSATAKLPAAGVPVEVWVGRGSVDRPWICVYELLQTMLWATH